MAISEEAEKHRYTGTKFAGGTDVARGPGAPDGTCTAALVYSVSQMMLEWQPAAAYDTLS